MSASSGNVTFKLVGGLGNQLFIWATAYSFAKRTGKQVALDASECTMWGEQLGTLNIQVDIPGPLFPDGLLPTRFSSQNNPVLESLRSLRVKARKINRGKTFWENPHIGFDPRVFDVNQGAIVRGYFQSYKYFDEYSEEIKGVLKSKIAKSQEYRALEKAIPTEFTAINLRLGSDYRKFESSLGLIGKDFLSEAQEIVNSMYPNQAKIVFTDDLELARRIIPKADLYIDKTDISNAGEKLLLMSKANSFIGSNSSFSWWAAYLMQRSDSLKVFPKPWFRDSKLNSDYLVPKDWVQVDN